MNERISKVLDSLAFQKDPDPVETLYLNEPRTLEKFVNNVGAIEQYVRSESREATLGADAVVQVGGRRETNDQVTWSLRLPITQAFVLRETLARHGQIRDINEAKPGSYVVVSGTGYLTGGVYETDYMRDILNPIEDGIYDEIESRRQLQETRRNDPKSQGLDTLTLVRHQPPRIVVTFLDERWIGGVSEHFEVPTEVFGVVRGTIGTAPLVSTMHAYVRYGGNPD
jgi:hypothetical protein